MADALAEPLDYIERIDRLATIAESRRSASLHEIELRRAVGRARAARNALRHALSLPVCSNPALSEEVETLAREIAGPGANAETQDRPRQVAEAQ